jgi:hypothetical protein
MDVSRLFLSHHVRLVAFAPARPMRAPARYVDNQAGVISTPSTMLPRRPPEHEDEELGDLPPIDGALGDEPESVHDLEEIDDPEAAGDGQHSVLGGFDDATGEDEPPDLSELEGDEAESGWVDESADSPELDLGDPMLLDAGEESLSLDDGEEPAAADEDFGIGEGGERSTLDAAEEGPIGADEELREADLPALDADDERDEPVRDDDEGLLDERFAGDVPLGAPWSAEPWIRVGPPLGLAWVGLARGITALTCAARGALVAGRSESGACQLVRVDLEGGRQVLDAHGLDGGRVTALAAEGDAVATVLEGGRLALSIDGGARFEPVIVPEGVAAADVALVSGVLWVRTRTGSLLVVRRDPAGKFAFDRCSVPGVVAALGRADGLAASGGAGIVALAVDDAGKPSTLVRGKADGTVACEAVQGPGGRPAGPIVARRDRLAYLVASSRGGVLVRQVDGGWKRSGWEGRVTALAMIDDAGTVVAATYSEGDDSTGLVRVDSAGALSVVARLGAARDDADADGRAVAMAYDDPRGVVWVAGGFGVAAFTVR